MVRFKRDDGKQSAEFPKNDKEKETNADEWAGSKAGDWYTMGFSFRVF